jgi:hypothetical protein
LEALSTCDEQYDGTSRGYYYELRAEPEDRSEEEISEEEVTQNDDRDDPEHLPPFAQMFTGVERAMDPERDRQDDLFNRFSRDVLGNSSTGVSDDSDGQPQTGPEFSGAVITGNGFLVENNRVHDRPSSVGSSTNFRPETSTTSSEGSTSDGIQLDVRC